MFSSLLRCVLYIQFIYSVRDILHSGLFAHRVSDKILFGKKGRCINQFREPLIDYFGRRVGRLVLDTRVLRYFLRGSRFIGRNIVLVASEKMKSYFKFYRSIVHRLDCGISILFIFRIPRTSNSFVILTMTLVVCIRIDSLRRMHSHE